MNTPRCLCTLDPLEAEGYSPNALNLLADGATFASTLGFTRADFFELRQETSTRMSISGVQDKLSLRLEGGALVPTEQGGTYILKPIPSSSLPRTDEVPANEHLTMQIASQVFGLEVAVNALVRLADGELAYLTRRFDRTVGSQKIPQEDFCQLLERTPERDPTRYKYSGSYEEIAHALTRYSVIHKVEKERLFKLLCVNYLLAN